MKNIVGIYRITNLVNNKIYIGSSEKINSRWVDHKYLLNSERHINKYLKRAWKKYGQENFKFEILETCDLENLIEREQYYLDTLLFAQEYIKKENYKFLKLGYNINPTAGKNRKGTHQSLKTIKQTILNSGRKRKIIVVNTNNEKIDEFEYIFEILDKYNISSNVIYMSINKKQFTKRGIGFLDEEDFLNGVKLVKHKMGGRIVGDPYLGKKRKVFLYTMYGEFITSFDNLHKCAKYFQTSPSNVHRKMNILIYKKNIIDSELSKHILLDRDISIKEVADYWKNVFYIFSKSNGNYKVYDCFDNYIGIVDIPTLSSTLELSKSAVYSAVNRDTYLKTLKIVK